VADTRIEELRKRLEKEPGSRIFAQLAEELRKEGEFAEAISVAREGLVKHPAYHSARMTLARALLDTGDLARSRPEFEAVLKAAPDNILASRLLGDCLEGLGDLAGARARFKTTLALAPGDKQVQASLEGVETKLAGPAAPQVAAAPASGAPGAESEPAPIPLVAADEPFELETAHEAPFRGVASPPPAAPAAPTAAAPPAPPPATVAPAAPAMFEPEPEPEFVDFEAEARSARTSPIEIVSRVPLVPEPAPGEAMVAPPAPVVEAPLAPTLAPAAAELASPTLAELYWSQGHAAKAIDVYQELLERDPGNERVRARLSELKSAAAAPVPPVSPADPREARRSAIRRTISRLEGMLDAVKRG